MQHKTEVIPRAGGLFETHCTTCNWRPAKYATNPNEAEVEGTTHERESAQGKNQISHRSLALAPSINHARDMATRETTPLAEAVEWTRFADEMERHLKTKSRTKAHEILEGQESLFDTEGTPK